MPILRADLGRCEGYANCVIAAPELLDIDDQGSVVLLQQEIPNSERSRAESAARTCPVSALTIDE
jgi:3-phenylpropionate/trans-cinnamate dioxygenase ferredoxin reductase subunit